MSFLSISILRYIILARLRSISRWFLFTRSKHWLSLFIRAKRLRIFLSVVFPITWFARGRFPREFPAFVFPRRGLTIPIKHPTTHADLSLYYFPFGTLFAPPDVRRRRAKYDVPEKWVNWYGGRSALDIYLIRPIGCEVAVCFSVNRTCPGHGFP